MCAESYPTMLGQRATYFLRIANAARMIQARIAAVQIIFQTFSGIFVLRFITKKAPGSARLYSDTKTVQNEKDGSPFGKPS